MHQECYYIFDRLLNKQISDFYCSYSDMLQVFLMFIEQFDSDETVININGNFSSRFLICNI